MQGATLRIEATGTPFDPATYQAVIFDLTSAASSTVSAGFRKAGRHIDAMRFTGRKMASGGPWLDLGRLMATPATLHIPIALAGQPEEWEIRGQCYIRDTPVGLPSEIATVPVQG